MLLENIWDTLSAVNFVDLVDIAMAGVLIYYLLVWFKQTKAAFVATGILIFALFYFIAKLTGMFLTTWIFQGFFAVFLIALVVIFQEELRSFFERLAVWSLGRRPAPAMAQREQEALLRAVGDLAYGKTGALIVLKGRDPLERHLQGGVELGGKISSSLLESIFDKHSEGHDGAVVIEEGRISRFAAQLPLSRDFQKLPGMGTRHAAALGLAERTDAFCIVVSEEKGTISVAQNSHIDLTQDLSVLERRISRFLMENQPPAPPESPWAAFQNRLPMFKRVRWSEWWSQNPREKIAALTLAFVLWLVFVQGFKPITQDFDMPVVVSGITSEMELRVVQPSQVSVHLGGLKRDFDRLKSRNLNVYVNVSGFSGNRIRVRLTEDHLRIPENLRLVQMEPEFVDIETEPKRRPERKP